MPLRLRMNYAFENKSDYNRRLAAYSTRRTFRRHGRHEGDEALIAYSLKDSLNIILKNDVGGGCEKVYCRVRKGYLTSLE